MLMTKERRPRSYDRGLGEVGLIEAGAIANAEHGWRGTPDPMPAARPPHRSTGSAARHSSRRGGAAVRDVLDTIATPAGVLARVRLTPLRAAVGPTAESAAPANFSGPRWQCADRHWRFACYVQLGPRD